MEDKKFNIHEWQANQVKQNLTEHTVNFSKKDMADLHKKGKIKKKDDTGKEHTYIFKGDLNEQDFDSRFKDAMGGAGFSDEEQDDIMSRDVGSPFPGNDQYSPFAAKAKDYIEKFRQEYREMSDDGIDEFSVEIINHLLDNTAAQAAAKVFFGKREL